MQIVTEEKKENVVAIYRSPNASEKTLNELDETLNKMSNTNAQILVGGDFTI